MSESPQLSKLTSRLSDFNPFSRPQQKEKTVVDDDLGLKITESTVAGGGHGARQSAITRNQLRVSKALQLFLVDQGILSTQDVSEEDNSGNEPTKALRALIDKPHIDVPVALTDRSHPLPEYFVSSSHNTYLVAHQLFGSSKAEAYETALRAGARCVEIDAWDNDDDPEEPKVTHGYTLVSNISFRSVCETIRDSSDAEAASSVDEQGQRASPILLSLENHCDAHGQLRLAQIMKEVWGDRLLSEPIRQEGHREQEGTGQHVLLNELGSKIVVIVEHHIANEAGDHDEGDVDFDDAGEEEKAASKAYSDKKKAAPQAGIIPELADLGVYAQSVKPSDNSWYAESRLRNGPHHHLINVSESGLASHMPAASAQIGAHNAQHLMRVFPKGTRISSKNLNPVPFWGVGAQICALNWQTFGAGMQMNEALFSGSDGYVLKPAALRAGGSGRLSTGKWKKLRLHIAGATEVPVPEGHDADEIKPYVSCLLVHPDDAASEAPVKRKTAPYKHHKLGFLHKGPSSSSSLVDPVWDETLEWNFEENELVFLRMLVKSDDSFATNPVFAVAAVRLLYVVPGWSFIRLLDLKGRETRCSLLVKFEILDV